MTADDDPKIEALARTIAVRLRMCSEDELRVLDLFLRRLEHGREIYGFLDLKKPRDWEREEAEEHFDAAFYRSCRKLVKDDLDRDRLRCEAADDLAANNPCLDRTAK